MTIADGTSAISFGQAASPVAAWPEADLTRRLMRALDFAAVVVADFGTTGYADPVRPALGFGPEKVVAEATMLAYAASRVPSPAVHRRVAALVSDLAPLARSRAALADLVLHPDRAFKRAVPHVLLTRLGQPDIAFDAPARAACNRVLSSAADEAATVHAERQWIAALWGLDAPARVDPTQTTALGRPVNLLADGREDPYGLTHLLFYVTDFGRRTPRLGRPRADLLADVEALLVRYLDRDDFDLCAELLMAWPQLRAPWSPTAAFAFQVLAVAEDEVGVLPCGNVDSDRLATLQGPERTRYARATSYHTALVMGFLCAVCLAADTPPPSGCCVRPPAQVPAGSQWERVAAVCRPEQHGQLAPMRTAIAIDRALRAKDFRALHLLLGSTDAQTPGLGPWRDAGVRALQLLALATAPAE